MSEQFDAAGEQPEGAAPASVPVGERLRQAREARGLTVADIAQTLKLGARQVEALEAGDWSNLPGPTFIRGFVRNYARLTQIDATPLMAELERVLEKPKDLLTPETHAATASGASFDVPRRDRNVVITGIVLVLLAGLAYFLIPSDLTALRDSAQAMLDGMSRKEQPAAPTPEAAPAAAPQSSEPVFPPGTTQQQVMNPQALVPAEVAPAAANATPAATPDASAPQLRFVFDKDSWVEVRDRDNQIVYSQRLRAGSEQNVSGQGPLSIVVGYAPGVRLFWRGQPIDLAPHTRGDVARLVLE